MIFICLMIVVFPDSSEPRTKINFERYLGKERVGEKKLTKEQDFVFISSSSG